MGHGLPMTSASGCASPSRVDLDEFPRAADLLELSTKKSKSEPRIFGRTPSHSMGNADGPAQGSAGEAHPGRPPAHFSDRMRKLGGSDSRLGSQPSRIKS